MMFCYSVVGLRIRQLFIKGRICWAELSWGVSKDYGHEEITLHKLGVGAILFYFFFLLFIYRVNLCCTCFIFFLLSFSFLVVLNGFALKFYYTRLVFISVFFTAVLKICIFKTPLSKFVYKWYIDWIYNNQFCEIHFFKLI